LTSDRTVRRAGFDPARLNQAHALLRGYVEGGVLPGAATYISRHGEEAASWYLGYADPATERPVTAETLFPLASITKPMTAALVLTLVEAGQIALDEPVCTVLPELLHPATERITLRHMLTHTSGLPGYLAENAALRAKQQPLARFVEASLRTAPRFPPGTQFCYSNVALALLGEVASRLAGGAYAGALRSRVLQPWGLDDVYLPIPETHWSRTASVRDAAYSGTDHETFNSPYFRGLGIPWGGAYASAQAVAAFAQPFLAAWGAGSDDCPLSVAARRQMTMAQATVPPAPHHSQDDMAAQDWPRVSWGLGWDIKAARQPHFSGDLTSPATFGHLGASGAAVWADPASGVLVVLLTNRALSSGWASLPPRQARFANAVMAAAR
jgi:beta-lactamase class C